MLPINKNHAVGFPLQPANVLEIFIHNAYTKGTAAANCQQDKYSSGFNNGNANFYVDHKEIWESVPCGYITWHSGNWYHNTISVSIEICEDRLSKAKYMQAEANALALAAYLFKLYGLSPSNSTLRLHEEVYPTACPAISKKYYKSYSNVKKEFIKKIKVYMKDGGLMQKVTLTTIPWAAMQIKLNGDRKAYSSIPTSVSQAKKNAKLVVQKGHIYNSQGKYTHKEYKGIDAQGRKVPFTRIQYKNSYYYMPIYDSEDIKAKMYKGTPDVIRYMLYEEHK